MKPLTPGKSESNEAPSWLKDTLKAVVGRNCKDKTCQEFSVGGRLGFYKTGEPHGTMQQRQRQLG